MVELIKRFAKSIFGKSVPIAEVSTSPVYKTRTQIIREGKSAYLPKRHIHGVPHLIKKH
jgi:hypothetical protein